MGPPDCFRARVRRDGSRCRCWWRTGSRAGAAGVAGTRAAAAGPARLWRAPHRTWLQRRARTGPTTRPRHPITRSWLPASATSWARARVCSTARTRGPAPSRACSSNSSRSAARIYRCRAAPGSARHPRRGRRPTPTPPSQAPGPSPRIRPLGTLYQMTVLRTGGVTDVATDRPDRIIRLENGRRPRDEPEASCPESWIVPSATAINDRLKPRKTCP